MECPPPPPPLARVPAIGACKCRPPKRSKVPSWPVESTERLVLVCTLVSVLMARPYVSAARDTSEPRGRVWSSLAVW